MDAQPVYRHTQRATVIIASTAPVILLMVLMAFLPDTTRTDLVIAISFAAVFLLVTWLFGSLTVMVGDGAVELRFGPGLIHKHWPLSDFVSVSTARNRWWYGWGIRILRNGWLYNVSGLDAVELVRSNGRVLRIGTDEPEALLDALRKALPK